MSLEAPTLDVIRRLAEQHARQELATHGFVTPSATLFYGAEADVVSANEGEAWSAFVAHMLSERTKYKAHAVVLYRQVGGDVAITVMPSTGIWIELRIPLEVA